MRYLKGFQHKHTVVLNSVASSGFIKATPTLASGDVKIYKDGAAGANLASLPSEFAAGTGLLEAIASATESNCDRYDIVFQDQTSPPEWYPVVLSIQTVPSTPEDFMPQGYCQSGGSSTTVKLASTASATDDIYNNQALALVFASGERETVKITDYVGSTKIATVDRTMVATPSTTDYYYILGLFV